MTPEHGAPASTQRPPTHVCGAPPTHRPSPGEQTAGEASPVADANGSIEYKRQLVRVLTARAIQEALQQATPA